MNGVPEGGNPVTLIGGCADGQVRVLHYPLPFIFEHKQEDLAPVGTPIEETRQARSVDTYYRHELHMQGGVDIPLYILESLEPHEAINLLLDAYQALGARRAANRR